MCCYFYFLSIVEFTYFMYKIVNKVTFIVADTIKAYIKKNRIYKLLTFLYILSIIIMER